jgi:hypothetical protein
VTAPLDLGASEDRYYDRFRPNGGAFLSEQPAHIQALVAQAHADARELAGLKSALEFLEALDDDDVSPPCADVGEILKYARELGWTPGDK